MQRYLTLRDVSERLGCRSPSAIHADLGAGRLPKPVRVGARICWPEDDLAAHLRGLAGDPGEAPMRRAA